MTIVEFLMMFGGAIIGAIVFGLIQRIYTATGTLKIDRSNPEKDVYRLEINKLDNLHKKRQVVLKVDPNANLSQE